MKKITTLIALLILGGTAFGQTIGLVNLRAPTSTVLTADAIVGDPGDFIHIPENGFGGKQMRWYDGEKFGGYRISSDAGENIVRVYPTANPTNNAIAFIAACAEGNAMYLDSGIKTAVVVGAGEYSFTNSLTTLPAGLRIESADRIVVTLGDLSSNPIPNGRPGYLSTVDFNGSPLSLDNTSFRGILINNDIESVNSASFIDCAFYGGILNGVDVAPTADTSFVGCLIGAPILVQIKVGTRKLLFDRCAFSNGSVGSFTQFEDNLDIDVTCSYCKFETDNMFIDVTSFLGNDSEIGRFFECDFAGRSGWFGTKTYASFVRCTGLHADHYSHASTTVAESLLYDLSVIPNQ